MPRWWQCWGCLNKPSCNKVVVTKYSCNEKKCPVCGGNMMKFYEREDESIDD